MLFHCNVNLWTIVIKNKPSTYFSFWWTWFFLELLKNEIQRINVKTTVYSTMLVCHYFNVYPCFPRLCSVPWLWWCRTTLSLPRSVCSPLVSRMPECWPRRLSPPSSCLQNSSVLRYWHIIHWQLSPTICLLVFWNIALSVIFDISIGPLRLWYESRQVCHLGCR